MNKLVTTLLTSSLFFLILVWVSRLFVRLASAFHFLLLDNWVSAVDNVNACIGWLVGNLLQGLIVLVWLCFTNCNLQGLLHFDGSWHWNYLLLIIIDIIELFWQRAMFRFIKINYKSWLAVLETFTFFLSIYLTLFIYSFWSSMQSS